MRRRLQAAVRRATILLVILLLSGCRFESADGYADVSDPPRTTGAVTVSVICPDAIPYRVGAWESIIPETGVILPPASAPIGGGDTVFSVLDRLCRRNGIALLSEGMGGGVYVISIGHLAEKALASTAGWIYTVNGQEVWQSSGAAAVSPGDIIEWRYIII